MPNPRRLRGRRIAILAADGFERIELAAPLRALQLAGAKVEIVSLRRGRIRGMNLHEPAARVHVDYTLDEVEPLDYDALFIPGGFISPDLLRQSADARAFVRGFEDKPIATLCHGPWVLASAGMLRGRTLTSWPGIRDDMVNAGATWIDQPVVRDGNLLTSRGPQDIAPFVRALLGFFELPEPVRDDLVPSTATASAPPPEHPPRLTISALRWIPRPSLRAIGAVLLVGLGLGALQYRRLRSSAACE